MSKRSFLNYFKWVFALGVLFLLIRSGKLSLNDVQRFVSNPRSLALCLLMVLCVYLCAFFRWNKLLQSQGIELSYWTTLRLGMLGQFFSAIIPGTVGGDLVKAVYVARRFPSQKLKTVTTIFLDRFMGLGAMILLGGWAFLLGRRQIQNLSPHASISVILSLGWLLLLMAVLIVVGLLLFPLLTRHLPEKIPSWIERLPLSGFFSNLYEIGKSFHQKAYLLWSLMLLSLGMHSLNLGVLWVAANSVFGPAPWGPVTAPLFVIASILGLCAMALPVAPLGLGVGQLAFGGIFAALSIPVSGFGVTIVTASQIVSLSLNLCGAFFFASYRHEAEESLSAPSC